MASVGLVPRDLDEYRQRHADWLPHDSKVVPSGAKNVQLSARSCAASHRSIVAVRGITWCPQLLGQRPSWLLRLPVPLQADPSHR